MKQNRFWLKLVMVCAITSLLLGLGLAAIGGTAALALANGGKQQNVGTEDRPAQALQAQYQAASEQTFAGVLTDSMCGAKHDRRMGQSAAGCTKLCLKKGASFALVDGDKVYKLQGQDEFLDRLAGERISISGTLNGDTIRVNSVDAMNK